jgi:hypothetical protein
MMQALPSLLLLAGTMINAIIFILGASSKHKRPEYLINYLIVAALSFTHCTEIMNSMLSATGYIFKHIIHKCSVNLQQACGRYARNISA